MKIINGAQRHQAAGMAKMKAKNGERIGVALVWQTA
jgi:hypothetical protein